MARILYVDDEPLWIDIFRRALKDHHIDAARTYAEALELIYESYPYDVAIVDLHLESDRDLMGGEIIDLLRAEAPSTRLIMLTGDLPAGSLRANIFERFGVDEIIVKRNVDIPGLRRVVAEALTSVTADISPHVKMKRSELAQRYRDWRHRMEGQILEKIRTVREGEESAQHGIDPWLTVLKDFRLECATLETALSGVKAMGDLGPIIDLLDRAEETLSSKMDEIAS